MASLLSSSAAQVLLRGAATDPYTSASTSTSLVLHSFPSTKTKASPPPPSSSACSCRRQHLPVLSFHRFEDLHGRNNRGTRNCSLRAATARGSNCSGSSSSSSSLQWQESLVKMEDRRRLLQQKGCIVWITGLSGSGKSTVAFAMDRVLNSMAKVSYVLDGDKIREGLCKDLGFSAADRRENIRRVGETAALFADAGLIAVVSFISPYKRDRDIVRELVPNGNFIEVFMDIPLEVCEARDAKGLYKLAREGVIKAFTGIDDPYEKPVDPEISIRAVNENGVCISPEDMARTIVCYLSERGFLSE